MPDRAALLKKTRTTTVEYDGERITITYAPAKITPRWEQAFNEALKGEWKSRAVVETLADALVEWDVTDGGKPFPPTVDNLVQLPMDLLSAVFVAIMEGQRPNRQSGGSFAAG